MRANQDVLLPFSLTFSRLLYKEKGFRLLSCSKNIKLYVTNTQLGHTFFSQRVSFHILSISIYSPRYIASYRSPATNETLVTQESNP